MRFRTKIILSLYALSIILLAFLVYYIVAERHANPSGFAGKKTSPVFLEEEIKSEPTFKLSDNIEVTQKDCAAQCQTFKNNPLDLQYCQNFCKGKGFPQEF
jgi:hypothetical protein